jgi:hypothetical protein
MLLTSAFPILLSYLIDFGKTIYSLLYKNCNQIYHSNRPLTHEKTMFIINEITKNYSSCTRFTMLYKLQSGDVVNVPLGYVSGPRNRWWFQADYYLYVLEDKDEFIVWLYGKHTIDYFDKLINSSPQPPHDIIEKTEKNKEENQYNKQLLINGNNIIKYTIYFKKEHYHTNAFIGAKLIYNHFIKNQANNNIYYLYGLPATGKSTTARYLSKLLNCYICENFGFFKNTNDIYYNVIKIKETYNILSDIHILLIDEFDLLIKKENEKDKTEEQSEQSEQSQKIKLTKKDWNYFADMCNVTKNLIVILTSNKDTNYYYDKDSILRESRIHSILKYTPNEVILERSS